MVFKKFFNQCEGKEEIVTSSGNQLIMESDEEEDQVPQAEVVSMDFDEEGLLTPQVEEVSERAAGSKHTPRCYQVELYEHAVEKNSILVLGTGSGKTFIAMLLIKHMAEQLHGKVLEGAKRTVMIANTVPLVRQQAKAIGQLTPYSVSSYDGSMGVDFWDREKWEEQLENNEVLVMVSQIFLDMLNHDHIKLSQVNLLIVDECHHATGNHPMREVMRRFSSEKRTSQGPLPRVLGLTASIIQKKCKKHEIPKLLFELEACLNSSLVTSIHYEEVLKHTTKPTLVLVDYCNNEADLSDHAKGLIYQLNSLRDDIGDMREIEKDSKKPLLRVFRNIALALGDLGEWCGSRAIKFEEEHFDELVAQEDHPHIGALLVLLHGKLEQMSAVCIAHEQSFDKPRQHVTNHVLRLLDVILKALSNPDSLILVFVKTRFTAFLLRDLLNELQLKDPKFKDALAQSIVGSNTNNPMGDLSKARELFKKQTETLEAFHKREFRILLSTSVLEEGVDVRKCNVVIRYDEPANFRAYVQSKGRARAHKSVYVLMIAPDSKLPEEVKMYNDLEMEIRNICHNRALPTDEEVAESFQDDLIEPYMPFGHVGPRITSQSSYNVLNRYCGILPQDKFTALMPQYKIRKDEEQNSFTATLSLPQNASFKLPVTGDAMESAEWAKKSAALKMCKMLHERGELNNRLLPNTEDNVLESLLEPILGDQAEEDIVPGKPGSKKRRQVYDRMVCDAFCSAAPGNSFYLYQIKLQHVVKLCDAEVEGVHSMGLLSHKELYTCSFPLYHNKWGEVSVTLNLLRKIEFQPSFLYQVEHFHKLVFELLVKINENVLEFNKLSSNFNCRIVPLMKNKFIDVELLTKLEGWESLDGKKPNVKSRQNFEFDAADYKDALVVPWYKERAVYSVVSVCEEVPSSKFPENASTWRTYSDYFEDKYQLTVYNQSQKLLECRHVPLELRCLTPIAKSSSRKHKDHPKFLPELCVLLPISIQLYHHIMCLPSIIHRINGLNVTSDFLTRLDLLPVTRSSNQRIDYNWSLSFTEDLIRSSLSRNVCVAFQENDTISFNEYNSLLSAGVKPDVRRRVTTRSCPTRDLSLSPLHFLQALTPLGVSDCFNFERLEVLGDSFLKFHVGQMLFLQHPDWHEGKLTANRSQFVSNKTLYRAGKQHLMPECLQATRLAPLQSGPAPGFELKNGIRKHLEELELPGDVWHCYTPVSKEAVPSTSNQKKAPPYDPWRQQVVPDKTVADSVEGLLGCTLLTVGLTTAHRLLLAFNFNFGEHVSVPTSALLHSEAEDWSEQRVRNGVAKLYKQHKLRDLERILGYTFRDKSFLLQAVTHPSFTANKFTDYYQRLEFLGDAVLDFLVTGHVFATPDLPPGRITDIRCHFVRNDTLARACVNTTMHKYLLHFCPKLQTVMARFIELVNQESQESPSMLDMSAAAAGRVAEDEVQDDKGVLNMECDVESPDHVEVPKVMGDVVEAMIGAVYLDSNLSLDWCWRVIKVFLPELSTDTTFKTVAIDCVRVLYEKRVLEDFDPTAPSKPGEKAQMKIKVAGVGWMTGRGKNLRAAKRAVCKAALERLYGPRWMLSN